MDFTLDDHSFLHSSQVFPLIRRVMQEARGSQGGHVWSDRHQMPEAADPWASEATPPDAGVSAASMNAPSAHVDSVDETKADKSAQGASHLTVFVDREVTHLVRVSVSTGGDVSRMLDGSTETYWESRANEGKRVRVV